MAGAVTTRRCSLSWLAYKRWRPGFIALLDPTFYTPDWLDGEVLSGAIRCWSNDEAAILAMLRTYPTGAIEVHGMAAVGSLAAIKALIPLAESWGLQNGAIVASIASRAGFIRALVSQGYRPHQVEIRKGIGIGDFQQQHKADAELHA